MSRAPSCPLLIHTLLQQLDSNDQQDRAAITGWHDATACPHQAVLLRELGGYL